MEKTYCTALVMNDVSAAELLGMQVATLRKWRCQGVGPAYIKCGRLCKYLLKDLEAYLDSQRVSR